ncbi:MAG: outer membrane lipoprotein-sorting protein [Halioglobus sp.]
MTAADVVAAVNSVDQGSQVRRNIRITMTDRNGKRREQSSVSYRKQYPDSRRTVMFFEQPANIRGTGFLIWDYSEPQADDDQWLYLPALRKARRVSSSDRGGYFLGTDFTYEDMKLDGKLEPLDYNFALLGEERVDGATLIKLDAQARDEEVARELGYSRTVSWIDPANWLLVKAEFYDPSGELLKTLAATDVRMVDGIWTRHVLTMQNHQTGHRTEFRFSDVDYLSPISDNLFSKQILHRGP